VREFIRPPVRALPCSMARRLGPCRISLPAEVASGVASRWTMTSGGLEVSVTTAGLEEHDVAMELLLCLGQGLWERLSDAELRAYWMLLNDEQKVWKVSGSGDRFLVRFSSGATPSGRLRPSPLVATLR